MGPKVLKKHFLDPMFIEGKAMKLYFNVQKLQLKELTVLPVPGLHMDKAMVCRAKNTTGAGPMPANVCEPWFHKQAPFPRVVPGNQEVPQMPSEDGKDQLQTADFVSMETRRLHANERKHGYE